MVNFCEARCCSQLCVMLAQLSPALSRRVSEHTRITMEYTAWLSTTLVRIKTRPTSFVSISRQTAESDRRRYPPNEAKRLSSSHRAGNYTTSYPRKNIRWRPKMPHRPAIHRQPDVFGRRGQRRQMDMLVHFFFFFFLASTGSYRL